MRFIRKKEIKFVKLLLISPLFEQITYICYLLSLMILFIKFLNFTDNFTNFEISRRISEHFEEDNFRKINNTQDFKNYLNTTVYKLYDYSKFPMFIPIGAIRLKKFSIKNNCYNITNTCKVQKSCIFILTIQLFAQGNIYLNH